MRHFFITILAFVVWFPSPAFAQYYDMYRVDYAKGAFCSAIAGACSSDDDPELSFFQNPAALKSGKEDGIIFDGDYNPSDNIEPGMKVGNAISDTTLMGGAGYSFPKWGFALALSGRLSEVKAQATLQTDDNGTSAKFDSTNSNKTFTMNIPVAYRVNPRFSLGVALSALYYQESFTLAGAPKSNTIPIDHFPQVGFVFGYLYQPNHRFRAGSWFRTSLTYFVRQDVNYTIGPTQVNITEDVGLHYPWIMGNGVSFMPWEDKRVFLFDLDFVGTTAAGYERTLDRYSVATSGASVTRAKGRHVVIEPHLAWRAPWRAASKFTYSAGAYYENSRWEDIAGRTHYVIGAAYDFNWLEGVVTADVARDFFALQFSFR